MPARVQLNAKQEALLRWIADGCPEGVMPDASHRITAAALRSRGLATTNGRGPSWEVKLTPAGIEHLGYLNALVARSRAAALAGASPEEIALWERPSVASASANAVRYCEVAREFRDRPERHEVSRQQLPRATRIVQLIVVAAEQRRWKIEIAPESENDFGLLDWTSAKDGHFQIGAGDCRFWLRLQEEGVHQRSALDDEGLGAGCGAPYDATATGRLKLELRWGEWYTRQQKRWADRSASLIEDCVPEVFQEMEERVAETRRVDEEKRVRAEREALAQRREREQREREWLGLMEQARERYFLTQRIETLESQAAAWEQAARLRRYCDAAAAAYPDDPGTEAWVAWARAYAAQLDPLVGEPPSAPAVGDPTPEQLQRHLPEGWSFRGP